MPDTLYIRRAAAFVAPDREAAAARIENHRTTLPRTQGRRMGPLALALDITLAGDLPGERETLVYASGYGTPRSLEDFVAGFPHPSPLAFQTAIHPAGIEQCLVPHRAALGELIPFAADDVTGLAGALRALFLAPGEVRRLVGGEEHGTWMVVHQTAVDETFAFAMTLTTDPAGAIGAIVRHPSSEEETPLSLRAFAGAIDERKSARTAAPGFGLFTLEWL